MKHTFKNEHKWAGNILPACLDLSSQTVQYPLSVTRDINNPNFLLLKEGADLADFVGVVTLFKGKSIK